MLGWHVDSPYGFRFRKAGHFPKGAFGELVVSKRPHLQKCLKYLQKKEHHLGGSFPQHPHFARLNSPDSAAAGLVPVQLPGEKGLRDDQPRQLWDENLGSFRGRSVLTVQDVCNSFF